MTEEHNNSNIFFRIEKYRESFSGEICSWVPDSETLKLIASEDQNGLTCDLLNDWIGRAYEGVILEVDSKLAGFATIGSKEWVFPSGICEIGHLIIHPELRRRYFGTMMLYALLHRIRLRGFKAGIARVLPDNIPALGMLKKQRWEEVDEDWCGDQFVWFLKRCNFKDDEISRVAKEVSERKGMVSY